ncbi:UPF0721 transmembrane protein [Reticulibacter mediterranei]|uniref:Probable membrane transporter protein n=1 Tax=Reticulibacter mediterranei TaxID=2778369 RepID=A0A8J3IEX8_9CHLR|nr:sulfite exporter TauE/SafE family protein [Reticulibacter mediterranei]GHO93131.1 UPF0721 transmembrane protein [Reticulibacter mediterranei]
MDLQSLLIILVLGALIGLALGALGGGGSILTVPILVYLLHLETHVAVTASLVIVGINALVGILLHYRAGHVNLKASLLFGIYGILASYGGARISSLIPSAILLVLFGLLMLVIALMMIRSKAQARFAYRSWWMTVLGGLGVGLLTGFLGVGGGFLIVPALVLFLGMSMPDAVGSSLVVIALNSVAGVLGHLNSGALPWTLMGLFALAGLIGLLIGTRFTNLLPPERLRQIFASFVLMLGIVVLTLNIPEVFHYLKLMY